MSHAGSEQRRHERWRHKLLPLITRMLVALTVFFFTISLAQIAYLHWRMEQTPGADLSAPMALLDKAGAGSTDRLNAANAMIMARLEANALDRRYHQASIVLMARVWTSYLGFVTGMILTLVGAAFTLGRVEETPTAIEARAGGVGGSLRTAAPGMVLTALGVVLMICTLFVHYDITVSDSAVYSRSMERPASDPESRPPSVLWPAVPPPAEPPVKRNP